MQIPLCNPDLVANLPRIPFALGQGVNGTCQLVKEVGSGWLPKTMMARSTIAIVHNKGWQINHDGKLRYWRGIFTSMIVGGWVSGSSPTIWKPFCHEARRILIFAHSTCKEVGIHTKTKENPVRDLHQCWKGNNPLPKSNAISGLANGIQSNHQRWDCMPGCSIFNPAKRFTLCLQPRLLF